MAESCEPGLVFGPVPSRRLGQSLGINNIPPKVCTYSCIYCQLGASRPAGARPRAFYDPGLILGQTREKIAKARAGNEHIDYLTIVSDGEPSLDLYLGRLIRDLKALGYKTAVITNSTLLGLAAVRRALAGADWVSVKVDALDEKTWRRIDRPYQGLELAGILDGLVLFSKEFTGTLVTETMLVRGVNDAVPALEKISAFIRGLNPAVSYLSIPTRPPAVKSVVPPEEDVINQAWQVFRAAGLETEYLIGYEGNQFAFTGDIDTDILSITAVHPMREDAVMAYLDKAGGKFSDVEKLVRQNRIAVSAFRGERFYVRRPGPLARP